MPASASLHAGHARRVITPPVGTYLAGYAARTAPSTAVHDDLYANAVALRAGEAEALLLALDVIGFDLPEMARLKAAVTEATGLAPEAILVNCSHTHAGPILTPRSGERFSENVLQGVISRCCEAAREAREDLAPAALQVGAAPVDIGANRREWTPDRGIILGVNPAGATLHEATLWRLAREGRADILLFSLPVHGTTMGGENLEISADWMGAAVREIEAAQPALRAVFLQGCAGDQNPYRGERTFARVAEHGRTVAKAVSAALPGLVEVAGTPLRSVARTLPLPLEGGGSSPCPLHGLRLGDAVLVGLGGEAFVAYALHARAASTAASTMGLGYTDGSVGYLPTAAAYQEGGYETTAYRYREGARAWDPGLERALREGIARLLTDLGTAR